MEAALYYFHFILFCNSYSSTIKFYLGTLSQIFYFHITGVSLLYFRMVTISKDGYWRFFDTQIEYEKGQEPYLLNSGKITVGSEFPTENACKIALSSDAKVAAVSCVTSITVFSTKTGIYIYISDIIQLNISN